MNKRLRKRLLLELRKSPVPAVPLTSLIEAASPDWTDTEVKTELKLMEASELVLSMRDTFDDLHYLLTMSGKGAAAQL